MVLPRPTNPAHRRALKIATQRTVQMCGGQDSAASITRVHAKTLSDYGNTGNERHADTFMPVDVFADLILDCAERGEIAPLLLRLNELAGGRFVPSRGNGKLALIDGMLRDLMSLREELAGGEGDE